MRVLLIVPSEANPAILAERLRMQGHEVDVAEDPAEGARHALRSPPAVVVADLWMPRISGVQLCLLLRSEVATEAVPVILRGEDEPRHRFWAEHAGAADYVVRGRTVDLLRALERAADRPEADSFFTHLDESVDIRDRIAAHLDAALFEAAIASEVRALSASRSFPRLFDRLCQFLSRVTTYRWLAVSSHNPRRLAVHATPANRDAAVEEARAALGVNEPYELLVIEDEDPKIGDAKLKPLVRQIVLDEDRLGAIAVAPCDGQHQLDVEHMGIVGRELASPLRLTLLLEETARLATTDPLTGAMNRRAFEQWVAVEQARATRLSYGVALVLVDVDHFKMVNDRHGHATGDVVLKAVATALKQTVRNVDAVSRWGGEEFVIALCGTTIEGALTAAERLRKTLEATSVRPAGDATAPLRVTASFGVSMLSGDLNLAMERADAALYRAKENGRNRVETLEMKPELAESA